MHIFVLKLDSPNSSYGTLNCTVYGLMLMSCRSLLPPVMEVTPEVVLREVVDSTLSQYAFCMCNPPFFKDTDERLGCVSSCSGRRPTAKTFSSATTGEAITQGGETEFVSRIIQDSLHLKTRVT